MEVYFYGDVSTLAKEAASTARSPNEFYRKIGYELFIKNIDPQDKPKILPLFDKLINRQTDTLVDTYRRCDSDGNCIWVKCRAEKGKAA